MKNTKTIAFAALCSLFLSACNSSNENYPIPLQASLIDASVEGVEFIIQNKSGFTDKNGSFTYGIADRTVAFEVGGVFLGSFDLTKLHSDKKILITDLVGVDRDDSTNPKVVRLLQFLQSLDDDNNPENGILITPEVRKGLEKSSINFTRENLKTDRIEKRINKVGKIMVTKESAIAHFEKTLKEFDYTKNTQAPIFRSKSIFTLKESETFVVDLDVFDVSDVRLSLSGADANSFNISDKKLSLNTTSDFITKSIYTVDVIAINAANMKTTQKITVRILNTNSIYDNDKDFIPDDIEIHLGMNPNNSDENNNGILDGLESNATFGDQFFDKQWHIRSLGTLVNDSNISTIKGHDLDIIDVYHRYMGYNKGNPIIVQVVDDGVDATHPDLKDNMDLTRSYNAEVKGDPSPRNPKKESHGTQVAGIMAARGFNQIGVRGIAPFAKIAGSNWMGNQTNIGLENAWLEDGIAVVNNSWGSYFDPSADYDEIMKIGTSTLRGAKGKVYVISAGNGRKEEQNTNFAYAQSSRYAIGVAALNYDNTYASYSAFGSNILVCGYSGDYSQTSPTIGTTYTQGQANNYGDIRKKNTWDEDIEKNYSYAMNGTSAAAPVVAASIALVLEACPDMTWRDVKYSVAKNAKMVDASNPSWVKNSAGLYHSIDYGYGLINPNDMIRECISSGYTLLSPEQNQTKMFTFNELIPDNAKEASVLSMEMTQPDINVEWVEVIIDNNSTFASDYEVFLTSPSGTKTMLLNAKDIVSFKYSEDWMDGGHKLSSVAFIGEKSSGTWKVDITDKRKGDEGSVKTIELKIYGHKE